jgi:hypothetical protein
MASLRTGVMGSRGWMQGECEEGFLGCEGCEGYVVSHVGEEWGDGCD